MSFIDYVKIVGDTFAASSDSITALAAIVGAILAFLGVQTWRHQLKGTSEYMLAKEVLKAAYHVREAFKHVRNPFMWDYEYPDTLRDAHGHVAPEKKSAAALHAYNERFKVLSEAFRILEDKALDAQVEWGAEYAEIMIPLRRCRGELKMAIEDHVQSLKPETRFDQSKRAEERELRSVLYYLGEEKSEHDKFTPDINSGILAFEDRLRPIIGAWRGSKSRRGRALFVPLAKLQ